jgi:3-oxoacyl-[acyl-carrier-protein] synthase II
VHNKVLVTGLGCINAFGLGVERFWSAMQDTRSAIGQIRRFSTAGYRTKIGGEIIDDDLSALLGFGVGNLSRNAKFAVAAAHEALLDSQLLDDKSSTSSVGICLGSGLGGIYFSEEAMASLLKVGPRGISPMAVPFVDPNSIVSQVAMKWGLTGRQFTVSTACSSSAHAMGIAMDMIRSGRCDAILTGGVEATMSPLIFAGFDRLRAMSARNETPETACRPFSGDRDGFVMAEGAAMLLIESESRAMARGAKIYAEVMGYGATGGAYHSVVPRPDGADLVEAMRLAICDAGISLDQVDLINPHGTGTKLNDEAELRALKIVFGTHLDNIAITPTKQLTGHMLGAAGALESLHVVKSISESCVTPIRYWDGGSDLNIAVGTRRHKDIRVAINNSFGFGNNNVSLVFGAYQ